MSETEQVTHDPREALSFEPEVGMVFEDARHDGEGELLKLVYLDEDTSLLRSNEKKERGPGRYIHRLVPRKMLEKDLGSGRLKLSDEKPDVDGGNLAALRQRATELSEAGGRKNQHYAEAFIEAVEILTEGIDEESRETVPFEEISGVGAKTAEALRANGYSTVADVSRAPNEDLLAVSGVGSANLENIREFIKT